MSAWYRDGERVASIPIDDRAFQYGDGLFETVAIRAGQPRLWDLHLERLAKGCERLCIQLPDLGNLRADLMSALEDRRESSTNCVAKIIVSSGPGQRGYGRLPPTPGVAVVGVFPARPAAGDAYQGGVATMLCETRLAMSSVTAGLKTLNRLEQVLGRSEVLANGAFEGLMQDADGRLICGTMSNVFIVSSKSVITPSLSHCGVEGVMRRFALATFADNGIRVDVRDISVDEFLASDEVFLTNSQFGALPVKCCGRSQWQPGPVSRECLSILADNGIAECAS